MNKLAQTLRSVLGESVANQLDSTIKELEADQAKALNEAVAEAKKDMEAEYNAKLVEAYKTIESEKLQLRAEHDEQLEALHQELEQQAYQGYQEALEIIEHITQERNSLKTALAESEEVAYAGYDEAKQIIDDLKLQVENVRAEAELHIETELRKAVQMIKEAQDSKMHVEGDVYEAFEEKLQETKNVMAELIGQFLEERLTEIDSVVRESIESEVESEIGLADKIAALAVEHGVQIEGIVESTKSKTLEDRVAQLEQEAKQLRGRNVLLESERDKALKEAGTARRLLAENAKGTKNRLADVKTAAAISEGTSGTESKPESEKGKTTLQEDKRNSGAVKLSTDVVSESKKVIALSEDHEASQWRKLAGITK